MSNLSDMPEELKFFITAPHGCSYLDGRMAVTLFADPERKLEQGSFSALHEMGFRRSGCLVYTPRCPECSACIPTRIPVNDFRPDRSQRRNLKTNQDLTLRLCGPNFSDAHIELYRRYVSNRHPGDSMDVQNREEIERFFLCDWSNTFLMEFEKNGKVLAVAVVDVVNSGLSAVYTFFDPAESRRGLGVFAVLSMIEETKRRDLPYLYLGYLIHESPKMAYKGRYQPLEEHRDGMWLREGYNTPMDFDLSLD